ncbi:MAG: amidohydrolase family protein [Pyrinomonadaceae bacterium]
MSSDRRTFLLQSTAAVASLLLPEKLLGQSNSAAAAGKTVAFTGGHWFDGQTFSDNRSAGKPLYALNGWFTAKKPSRIDSVIDLKNWFIVPPFGEAHNHNLDFSDEEQWARIKSMYLRDGILYIKNPTNLPRAAASLAGRINIPNSVDAVFAHGGMTATDGHPLGLVKRNIERGGMLPSDTDGGFCWIIDTVADLDQKLPRMLAGKPDFIKTTLVYSEEFAKRKDDKNYFTWKGLDPALLPEIVKRVHRAGLRVSTHVESATDFHHAVVAGADEINHLPGFRPENNDPVKGYDNLARYRISAADARLAGRRKIVVVTTSGTTIDMSFKEGVDVQKAAAVREMLTYNLQLLERHGVRIAIGSDSFRQTSQPEALALKRLGAFDSLTLLKMWCENTAGTIFPKRKLGHLKEGFEASFLALSGNPLQDFSNIKGIELRFKQGEII